jgi:hypothetical protein
MKHESLFAMLRRWPKYEADLSFRRYVDATDSAPEYTFAWFCERDHANE